jgi:hypothetical protein
MYDSEDMLVGMLVEQGNWSTEALPPRLPRHRVSMEGLGVMEDIFVFLEALLDELKCPLSSLEIRIAVVAFRRAEI